MESVVLLQVNNLMENMVKVLHCATSVNLSLTTETLDRLTFSLTSSLNELLNQLAVTVPALAEPPASPARFHCLVLTLSLCFLTELQRSRLALPPHPGPSSWPVSRQPAGPALHYHVVPDQTEASFTRPDCTVPELPERQALQLPDLPDSVCQPVI